MASVTFPPSVGGDGSTVTDDSNPTTGLGNGGHRTRFVPALGQVVAVAANTVTKATEASSSASTASNWATKTDNFVSGSDNSAKSWAVGGTGSGDPTDGSAKDWATQVGTTVDGSDYSSKEYAVGTTVPAGSAKEWSTQTGTTVDGSDYSSKEYAVGSTVPAGSAKEWSTQTGTMVDGVEYSAKEYASGVVAQSSKNWAVKTSGDVDGSEFSSKEYAVGTNIRGVAGKGSAKDWATYIGGTVDGVEYSAKKYAQDAAVLFEQFDDKYLGAKASDPTLDNDGNPLQAGATYVNTATNLVRFYTGSMWVNGIGSVAGVSSINGQTGDVVLSPVTIEGATSVQANSVTNLTITNFNSFSTYSVSVTSGSVSRVGDTITFTAPPSVGSSVLTVTTDGIPTSFNITITQQLGAIGTQGGQGFGVGVYPDTLPSGFSNLASNTDPAHANYGNYTTTNGSIMVFVPKFYYRIGNAASPRFATYGANAVDVVGIETYASEALANAAGYALHRAFKDGGAVKHGFFIDKYLASKDGTTTCKSVASVVPISLASTAGYTVSNGMTGCTGILADAVVLSRARGAGVFNVASVFMYSALALLSLAHAQASTSTTNCAWYDAVNNFPKGCNNGSLADTNDATVTYTTAGDSGSASKPLTRANANFAKTTHNGQESGVADLNGSLYQVALGITNFGTSATDLVQHTNGNVYVLKESVALASLTAGWDGATDAWGNTTSLATKYDAVTGLFPWGAATGAVYFGNGTNKVFSGATSGISYQRTACGVQDTTNGTSATGTDLFGKDYCQQYNRANMFVLCSGSWNSVATAGVFCRYWGDYRSNVYPNSGFRAAAFGS